MRKRIVWLLVIIALIASAAPLANAGGRDLAPAQEARSFSGPMTLHRLFIERARWIVRMSRGDAAVEDGVFRPGGLADDGDPIGLTSIGGTDSDDREQQNDNEGTDSIDGGADSFGQASESDTER